jgi:hypothetical protein
MCAAVNSIGQYWTECSSLAKKQGLIGWLTSCMIRPFLSRTALVLYMLRRRTCRGILGETAESHSCICFEAGDASRTHRGGISLPLPTLIGSIGVIAVLRLSACRRCSPAFIFCHAVLYKMNLYEFTTALVAAPWARRMPQ